MYKIIDIRHTGSFGERGTKRRENPYRKRIGRTVTDENGNDYSDKFLCCSILIDKILRGKQVILETQNTIYILEKIDE